MRSLECSHDFAVAITPMFIRSRQCTHYCTQYHILVQWCVLVYVSSSFPATVLRGRERKGAAFRNLLAHLHVVAFEVASAFEYKVHPRLFTKWHLAFGIDFCHLPFAICHLPFAICHLSLALRFHLNVKWHLPFGIGICTMRFVCFVMQPVACSCAHW